MRILALDLGTLTGWAILDGARFRRGGTWDVSHAEPADRVHALRAHVLGELACGIDLVAYEHVPAQAHSGGDAAHLWGAWWGIVLLCCADTRTRYLGIRPAAWKRAAGLRSGSKTPEALAAAQRRWPGVEFESADEAVARWVAVAAARRLR